MVWLAQAQAPKDQTKSRLKFITLAANQEAEAKADSKVEVEVEVEVKAETGQLEKNTDQELEVEAEIDVDLIADLIQGSKGVQEVALNDIETTKVINEEIVVIVADEVAQYEEIDRLDGKLLVLNEKKKSPLFIINLVKK